MFDDENTETTGEWMVRTGLDKKLLKLGEPLIKRTVCPGCGDPHRVQEAWTQATRSEPSQFLNEYIICTAPTDSVFGSDVFRADGRFE